MTVFRIAVIVRLVAVFVRLMLIEESIAIPLGVLFGIVHAASTPQWLWSRAGLHKGRWVGLQVVALFLGVGLVGFILYGIRARPRLTTARARYLVDRDAASGGHDTLSHTPAHNHRARPDEPTISGLDVASIRRALGRD